MDKNETNDVDVKSAFKQAMAEIKAEQEEQKASDTDIRSQIKEMFLEMQATETKEVEVVSAPVVRTSKVFKKNYRYNKLIGYKESELDQAYDDGMWYKAAMLHESDAKEYCDVNGIEYKAANTTNNAAVIPEQLLNRIIIISNDFGIIRSRSNVFTATEGTMLIPKNGTNTIAYYATEGSGKTESDPTTSQVEVTIKTLAVVTKLNLELIQDSVIDMISYIVTNMAQALAEKQDEDGFTGDGGVGAGGITGIIPAIEAVGLNNQSIVNPASATPGWDAIVLADFNKVMGRLNETAWKANDVAWYCSNGFYHNVMNRIKGTGNGNDITSLEFGFKKNFLGHEVVTSSIFPSTEIGDPSVGDDYCLFGSLKTVAAFADRMSKIVKQTSEGAAMLANQTWLLSELRWGYKVHDVGTVQAGGSMILLQQG